MSSFASKSENLRRDFAEQLRASNVEKESLRNNYSKLSQAKQLNEVKFEIIEEQLKFLYGSLQFLSNSKNLEDKFQFQIDSVQAQLFNINIEKTELQSDLRKTTTERDGTREDLRDMTASRTTL